MKNITKDLIGAKVIIRSDASGVHHGILAAVDGRSVRLTNSRRLWEWDTGGTGISLTEIAICGIDQAKSRITAVLPDLVVAGVCEIIPSYGVADATIEGAKTYTP